jgi:hypothetical protein
MKRLSGFILMAAIMFFAISQVSAQDAVASTDVKQDAKQNCAKFVDSNKDGICDNCAGTCKEGKGANFVDANGDGICDHHADGTGCNANENCCKQKGQESKDCCKGPNHAEQGKGCGEQQKHGCASACPGHSTPDKK